ncbi:hypothetical protein [Streptomyces prasinosporus]|uniref:hypothetical protein n=1 Tax=Streptomyces prasinosporus TaxID=68256 RepID=UPI0031EA992D
MDLTGEGGPHRISCDGVGTVGLVHTDAKQQALRVDVSDGNPDWTVAVVSGAHTG